MVAESVSILRPVYEPPYNKTNKVVVRPSAQSNQRLRSPHEESSGPKLPIERTAKTLIRLAEADLNLRWAHRSFCWFCHVAAHIVLAVWDENVALSNIQLKSYLDSDRMYFVFSISWIFQVI